MATEADEFNKAFSSGSADLTRMYAEDGIAFGQFTIWRKGDAILGIHARQIVNWPKARDR